MSHPEQPKLRQFEQNPASYEERLGLVFNGQRVDIYGASKILNLDRISELSAAVTDLSVLDTEPEESSPKILYSVDDEVDIFFDDDTNTICLSGPESGFGSGSALVYIAEYLATSFQARQNGIFLIHAAATFDETTGRSNLFIGEKGSGKTTVAIRLCHERAHGLIGNDQVYAGGSSAENLSTYRGNRWFNIRDTAIESDEYLRGLVGNPIKDDSKPAWNNKQRVEPDALGIKVHNDQAEIDRIFHVRIDPSQPRLYAELWQGVQRNLHLHEKIGRHALGQATPFQDDRGNYIGTLPLVRQEEVAKRRDELTALIISKGITELFVKDSLSAVEYIESTKS